METITPVRVRLRQAAHRTGPSRRGDRVRELIDLLTAAGFEVYICSAGGRDFARVVSQEMYGIPPQRVIGSGAALEYRRGEVYRTRGHRAAGR